MSEGVQPKLRAGQFQWNAGGWFGAQLGSTCWLLLLSLLLIPKSLPLAAAILAYGLVPNIVGTLIWRRRASLAPYPAIQCLIGLIGVCTLAAFVTLDLAGQLGELQQHGSSAPQGRGIYWLMLMFPGMMMAFHHMERAGRRAISS